LNAELTATPIEDWKKYLQTHLVMAGAPFLDQTFADYFEYHKTLTGASMPRPRWKKSTGRRRKCHGRGPGTIIRKGILSRKKQNSEYSDEVEPSATPTNKGSKSSAG